jgi:hypothetical protein
MHLKEGIYKRKKRKHKERTARNRSYFKNKRLPSNVRNMWKGSDISESKISFPNITNQVKGKGKGKGKVVPVLN